MALDDLTDPPYQVETIEFALSEGRVIVTYVVPEDITPHVLRRTQDVINVEQLADEVQDLLSSAWDFINAAGALKRNPPERLR